MKITKIHLKYALKLYLITLIPAFGTLYFWGIYPAIFSGLASFQGFLLNSKGFYRKRIFYRSLLLAIGSGVSILLASFHGPGNLIILLFSFIYIFWVTFFSLERHLGGLMAHTPILLIYVLAIPLKVDVLDSVLSIFVGVAFSCTLNLFVYYKSPEDNIRENLRLYLDSCLKKIKVIENGEDFKDIKHEIEDRFKILLNGVSKVVHNTLLGNEYENNVFEFFIVNSNLMKKVTQNSDKLFNSNTKISIAYEGMINNDLKTYHVPEELKKDFKQLYKKKAKLKNIQRNSSLKSYFPNSNFFFWLKANLSKGSVRFRYAIKIAVILTVGIFLSTLTDDSKSVWLPSTALLIIQPYEKESFKRVFERIIGTLAGVGLATILIPLMTVSWEYPLISVLSFFPGLLFLIIDYQVAVMFFTLNAIFMSVTTSSPNEVYFQRGYYTIIAGLITIIGEWIFTDRKSHIKTKGLISILNNDVELIKEISKFSKGESTKEIREVLMKSYLLREDLRREPSTSEDDYNLNLSSIFLEKLVNFYYDLKKEVGNLHYQEALEEVELIILTTLNKKKEKELGFSIKRYKIIKEEIKDPNLKEIMNIAEFFYENI